MSANTPRATPGEGATTPKTIDLMVALKQSLRGEPVTGQPASAPAPAKCVNCGATESWHHSDLRYCYSLYHTSQKGFDSRKRFAPAVPAPAVEAEEGQRQTCVCGHARSAHDDGRKHCLYPGDGVFDCDCQRFAATSSGGADATTRLARIVDLVERARQRAGEHDGRGDALRLLGLALDDLRGLSTLSAQGDAAGPTREEDVCAVCGMDPLDRRAEGEQCLACQPKVWEESDGERLAKAQAAIDGWRNRAYALAKDIAALRTAVADAEGREKALREAFDKFAWHDGDCKQDGDKYPECTCGYDEARAALAPSSATPSTEAD